MRKKFKQKRSGLDFTLQQQASEQVFERLITNEHFIHAKHIALYSAIQGEIDSQRILARALTLKKCCYFPVLFEQKLVFIQIDKNTPVSQNPYGILEPRYDASRLMEPQQMDVVLVPLVAFDAYGHRLGMGKGYYDRTFAFKQNTDKPHLLGLAYDFQRAFIVPHSNLDVLLDEIVTEKRSYLPPKTRIYHPKTTDP